MPAQGEGPDALCALQLAILLRTGGLPQKRAHAWNQSSIHPQLLGSAPALASHGYGLDIDTACDVSYYEGHCRKERVRMAMCMRARYLLLHGWCGIWDLSS